MDNGMRAGHVPRLAHDGLDLMAPLDTTAFLGSCVSVPTSSGRYPGVLRDETARIEAAAQGRDRRSILAHQDELLRR